MNLIKLYRFDFKHGIIGKYYYFLIYILITLFAVIKFKNIINSFEYFDYTLGDCLLYIYGGKKEYIPRIGEAFEIPYIWLVNHMILLYLTLYYMYKDLSGFGQHIIYRTGSRIKWWLSKCIWNTTMIMFLYAAGFIVICIFCRNSKFSFEISGFMFDIVDFGPNRVLTEVKDLSTEIIFMPLLFSVSISLFQMTLTLLVKPVMAYIFTSAILLASTYKSTYLLPGNYAMASRSDCFVNNGFDTVTCIHILLWIMISSIIVGAILIQRCNIINKEQ